MTNRPNRVGLVILDKPEGLSSNRALQIVKRAFKVKKAGHGGCLDPLATGVLPIYLGEATKFCMYSLGASKSYRVTAELGRKTTTGDREGELMQTRPVPPITQSDLLKACASLSGEIQQVPPMYSALKHEGQPLYRLARKGVTIERKARTITIDAFELVAMELPFVTFDVRCSKGTYIRTLMEDLGELFGCGATMTDLRRTASGQFHLDKAVTLDAIQACADTENEAGLDASIIPCEAALSHLPRCVISRDSANRLLNGLHVDLPGDFPEEGPSCLFVDGYGFIGLGERHPDGCLCAKRMMSIPAVVFL